MTTGEQMSLLQTGLLGNQQKHILIADDNESTRELLREALEPYNYQFVEAGDGHEVLQRIEERRPDVILLDVQMPRLDGYGVLARLREDTRYADLPVIALTAFAMRGDREKGLTAGFTNYVTKPIDIDALRRLVTELLM